MTMLPPQAVQLTCPNCRTQYQAPVFQMVDVGQYPDIKTALLSGRINMAVCPKCGTGGMLAVPMVYHDPAKQFFFVLFPTEVKGTPQEQEQFIGAMTQLVLRGLPPEAPKAYVLAPRRFITLNALLDVVLEGEGITKAQLAAQRQRTELLGQFLEIDNDPEALQALIQSRQTEIDQEFFVTISAYLQAADQAGDQEAVERFSALANTIAAVTGIALPQGDGEAAYEEVADAEISAALDALLAASDADLPAVIAEHRPALDYGFFEAITAHAERIRAEGDEDEAVRIEARRQAVLDTAEQMDRDAQALFEGAAAALREVLAAEDTKAALVEHREQLSDAFLLVIAANIEAAERVGNQDAADRLREIERLAFEVVQESLSPEERLINQLLNAETPQAASKLLRQNAGIVNTDFVKRINGLVTEMDGAARKEVSDRLRQLAREATSMLF